MFAFLQPKSGRKEGFPGKMVCFAFAHMYLESRPTDPLFSHGCTWLTLISQEKPPSSPRWRRSFLWNRGRRCLSRSFFGCWLGRVKIKVSPSCSFFLI